MAVSLISHKLTLFTSRNLYKQSLTVTSNRWSSVKRNSTFKGACLTEYGKPLTVQRFPQTNLKPGEVRVKVKYCSLNIKDVEYLENKNKTNKKLPFVPGYELSGEVLEASEDCEANEGQRIVALVQSGNGACATQAIVQGSDVWQLPAEVPTRDAAALICGHTTALLAFTDFRPLNEGDVILVIAGPGGYGLAAVETAASIFKAKVIALADTEGKASILRDRGAFAAFKNDLKLNYKEIMSVTDNKGVDLIYDAVGGPILNTVFKCMKDPVNGTVLATYRPDVHPDEDSNGDELKNQRAAEDKKKAGTHPERLSREVLDKLKVVNIFDCRNENHDKYYNLVEQTLQFCEDQLISAHVSKSFQLEDINEAIDYIKGKMCTGKVLFRIQHDD